MTKILIEIDTDTQVVVPRVPNDKLRNVLLEWCSTVEAAWFDILAAAASAHPEQAQQSGKEQRPTGLTRPAEPGGE